MNCMPKISDVQIENAEYLVMPMYDLPEYSKNYKKQWTLCGIITEMNHVILFLLILNVLNARQVL